MKEHGYQAAKKLQQRQAFIQFEHDEWISRVNQHFWNWPHESKNFWISVNKGWTQIQEFWVRRDRKWRRWDLMHYLKTWKHWSFHWNKHQVLNKVAHFWLNKKRIGAKGKQSKLRKARQWDKAKQSTVRVQAHLMTCIFHTCIHANRLQRSRLLLPVCKDRHNGRPSHYPDLCCYKEGMPTTDLPTLLSCCTQTHMSPPKKQTRVARTWHIALLRHR
jgi:hypothetical protein